MILRPEGITLLLTAVYRTPGGNVKNFIEIFTHSFEEKMLLYDRNLLLGDLNISDDNQLCVKNDGIYLWKTSV